jgi:glycosyltransferase involved in cell wall biosynthesis
VEPDVLPGGGTEAVAAWVMEALKKNYDVTLITFSRVEADMLNQFYGTELGETEISVIYPPFSSLLRRTRRLSMFKDHLMMRYCKFLHKKFDLFFAIGSGMDFGQKGIQYIAYGPGSKYVMVRGHDPALSGWYYFLKRSFARACQMFSGYSEARLQGNVTLATSAWTGKILDDLYSGQDYEVVYPPVFTPERKTGFHAKRDGFLCIARIIPEKMVDHAVEILRRVRYNGYDVSLDIIGRADDPGYFQEIKRLQAKHASWVSLQPVMPKDDLYALMDSNKYGINPALGEPSGVAALEMVKAGCIVFTRDGGGLPEIIDTPEVTYDSIDDGVDKITKVLSDNRLQQKVLDRLEEQGELFSAETFSKTIQRVSSDFFQTVDSA